jgi:predicted nucleotidyltransferase component of viral defense system
MTLAEKLEKMISALEKDSISYALAGGLVANLYRNETRFTNDIDFAVILGTGDINLLENIFTSFGLNSGRVREGDLANLPFRRRRKKTEVQMLVGRNPSNKEETGIDFLLKSIPWVEEAVHRAKNNTIEFSNFKIPALTLEDMIISKLYAIKNISRFKDLDDLEQFLLNHTKIDYAYLGGRMVRYKLPIPIAIRKKVKINPEIGRISREIEKMA